MFILRLSWRPLQRLEAFRPITRSETQTVHLLRNKLLCSCHVGEKVDKDFNNFIHTFQQLKMEIASVIYTLDEGLAVVLQLDDRQICQCVVKNNVKLKLAIIRV